MQNVKQTSKFNLLSASFLALFIMLLLSSCSKNTAEMPGQDNTELRALNQTSPLRTKNSLVAVPFEETLFVSCANGGAGENVALTGTTNYVYQMTWDDRGFKLTYHANSHRVRGVGLSSGETFVGSEGTQGSVMGSWINNQWVGTTIERMKIIGKNTKYTVRYKHHLVVTPDGKITVSISDESSDCDQ